MYEWYQYPTVHCFGACSILLRLFRCFVCLRVKYALDCSQFITALLQYFIGAAPAVAFAIRSADFLYQQTGIAAFDDMVFVSFADSCSSGNISLHMTYYAAYGWHVFLLVLLFVISSLIAFTNCGSDSIPSSTSARFHFSSLVRFPPTF